MSPLKSIPQDRLELGPSFCSRHRPARSAWARLAYSGLTAALLVQPAFAQSAPPAPPPVLTNPVILSTNQTAVLGAAECKQQYNAAINTARQVGLGAQAAGLATSIGAASAASGAYLAAATNWGVWAANLGFLGAAYEVDTIAMGVVSGGLAAASAGAVTGVVITGAAAPGLATASGGAGTVAGSDQAKVGIAAVLATQAGLFGTAAGAASGISLTQVGAFTAQATGLASQITAQTLTDAAVPIPNCDAKYIGTQNIDVGAGNQAIFANGNVGVTGNINSGGQLTGNQLVAAQGISSNGGAITLGNADLTTYQQGISIGGGAIAGAGAAGATSTTGDVSAIAIGNGASALRANSTALGTGASALGVNSTALGAGSIATNQDDTAIGSSNIAIGGGAGLGAFAGGSGTMAMGAGAVGIGAGSSAAIGNGAVAIGLGQQAIGNGAVAIGDPNTAIGTGAVAIGADNNATGQGAVALGNNNTAAGTAAIAIGDGSSANQNDSIALGNGARAADSGIFGWSGAIAIGGRATSTGLSSVAIGSDSNASGQASLAMGIATASGARSIAQGAGASASSADAIASGTGASASGQGSIAQGYNSASVGLNAVAIGAGSTASGQGSIAQGQSATASNTNAMASGTGASASGVGSIAQGYNSASVGLNAVAIGAGSTAGQGGVAMGATAKAYGSLPNSNNAAFGNGAQAGVDGNESYQSIAVGSGANANGVTQSTALGANASANGYNSSTALGQSATNTGNNQIMLGSGAAGTVSNPTNAAWTAAVGPTLQAPGITSQASRDAQIGEDRFTTTDAYGHLATSDIGPKNILFLASNVSALASSVYDLKQATLRGYEGSAVAMAVNTSTILPDNKKILISGNIGTFRGQNAFGASLVVRLNDYVFANAALGGGTRYGGVGGRAGLAVTW
jgi:hypothetical protein